MGAGGYFMQVPWALPVGLHIKGIEGEVCKMPWNEKEM
jgi:hypothetical protein